MLYAHPKTRAAAGLSRTSPPSSGCTKTPRCARAVSKQLLAAGPTGDMFWMFPVTAIAYLDQGQLSDSARQALRRSLKTYMPYRGDTENHWLLYYTTLYLMSQLWPDQERRRVVHRQIVRREPARSRRAGSNPGCS